MLSRRQIGLLENDLHAASSFVLYRRVHYACRLHINFYLVIYIYESNDSDAEIKSAKRDIYMQMSCVCYWYWENVPRIL